MEESLGSSGPETQKGLELCLRAPDTGNITPSEEHNPTLAKWHTHPSFPIALHYRYSLSFYVFHVSQGIALYPPQGPTKLGYRKIMLEACC